MNHILFQRTLLINIDRKQIGSKIQVYKCVKSQNELFDNNVAKL